MHQLDVKTAFLNGTLEEEDIWMHVPAGYSVFDKRLKCHLHKGMYGLRQAPRVWYLELKQRLTSIGFKPSLADAGLYIRGNALHPSGCLLTFMTVWTVS